MSSNYFAGKPSGQGASLYVSFNSKEQSGFLKFIKQTGWDATKKQASFKGGAFLNVKLSPDELADMAKSIRFRESTSFYHQFGGAVTTGKFSYYDIPNDDKSKPPRRGFGISFKKGNDEFKVAFSLGAAERLYEYIRFALQRMHEADYVADKKKFEASQAEKENATPKPVSAKIKPTPEQPDEDPEIPDEAVKVENDDLDF